MRTILLDLNVVLDVLLERRPHVHAASMLWRRVEELHVDAFLPAHGITTIFYLAERARDRAFARSTVESLLSVFGVAPVDEDVLRSALALPCPDFEDAVCAACAAAAGCELIATRDPRGFAGIPTPVMDPMAVVTLLDATREPGSG